MLGSDQAYFLLNTIVASGTLLITLTSFTNLGNVASSLLARIKSWRFHLLALSDLAPDGVTLGTACSGITIGGGTDPFLFGCAVAPTFTLNNGSKIEVCDGSAAGYPVTITTADRINITNLDAVNAARVVISFCGGST